MRQSGPEPSVEAPRPVGADDVGERPRDREPRLVLNLRPAASYAAAAAAAVEDGRGARGEARPHEVERVGEGAGSHPCCAAAREPARRVRGGGPFQSLSALADLPALAAALAATAMAALAFVTAASPVLRGYPRLREALVGPEVDRRVGQAVEHGDEVSPPERGDAFALDHGAKGLA